MILTPAFKKTLRKMVSDRLYDEVDWLAHRVKLAQRIKACAENGEIAVIESGRDCDGSQYSGKVRFVAATVVAYVAHANNIEKWADGPFSLTIEKPSVAEEVEYSSRDLALEAFEDGHAHCLHT